MHTRLTASPFTVHGMNMWHAYGEKYEFSLILRHEFGLFEASFKQFRARLWELHLLLQQPDSYTTSTQPDHDKLSTVTVHNLNFSSAFGGRIQQPLAVVLVATHADLADVPRAFSGEFSYDKERALLKEVRNRWRAPPLHTAPSGASLNHVSHMIRSQRAYVSALLIRQQIANSAVSLLTQQS